MGFTVYEQFAERNGGVFEGISREEALERYPVYLDMQSTKAPDAAPEGGESLRELCNRVDEGMRELLLKFRGKTVLLICHGYTARAVNRFCQDLFFDEMSGYVLDNCEVADYML